MNESSGSRTKLQVTRRLTSHVLLLALSSLLIVIALNPALRNMQAASLIWRNVLPLLLVALLVYACSRRILFSAYTTLIVTATVYAVSAIKQHNMNIPLMPGDLALWHQVIDNFWFFLHYVWHYKLMVLAVPLVLIGFGLIWRYETHPAGIHWPVRVALSLTAIICLYTMFVGDGFWSNTYSNAALDNFMLWSPADSVNRAGLIAGLVRMTQESSIQVPRPQKRLVRTFAAQHSDALQSHFARSMPADLPDLVVVQSEAFFDPGIMRQVDFGQFDPNFHRLSSQGISGGMRAPTYGGGTIRTEFETLTGYPMLAFPSVSYPYYGLASAWMPTVPSRLIKLGYSTTLFHPFRAEFWNRREIMPELGFQKTYFRNAFAKSAHAGLYVSDAALFDFVLAHLSDDASHPQFIMAITMENHGPWDRDPGPLIANLDGRPLPAGLSAAGQREMDYYLSHLVNGDKALGRFADQLMARKRWTILVFYGDHLPALNDAFDDIGFDDGGNFATQSTRYLIISNRGLAARTKDIFAYQLPGLLFDTIGLPEDGYLAFDAVARQLSAGDDPGPDIALQKMLYNAARYEVHCKTKLTLTARCSR